jgi:hypothetical protein
LPKPKRYRGTVLTHTGLHKLYTQIERLATEDGEKITPQRIAEKTQLIEPQGLNAATVRKILQAQAGVDQESLRLVFQALNLTLDSLDFSFFHHIRNSQALPIAVNHQQILDGTTIFSSNSINRDRTKDARRAKAKIDIPQYPGSPLPVGSNFYIERLAIQTQAYAELRQPGSLIWIKAPHKMGKSSLLLRILHQAKQLRYYTIHLDFQQADQSILSNLDKLLRWMCKTIGLQLQTECCLERFWDCELGCKVCFIIYLHHLLEQINQPLVLSLNEINRLFEYPDVYREFLPLLRSLNEEARYDQVLQKLRLVLVSSTDTCTSLNCEQLPFNTGLTLRLCEFSFEEVQRLALAYQLPWENSSLVELMDWVGGHPYLIQLAFYHLTTSLPSISTDPFFAYQVQQLLREATTLVGAYQNHLKHIWLALQADQSLLSTIEQLISQEAIAVDSSVAYKLEGLGIVRLDDDCVTLRCRLYYNFFKKKNLRVFKGAE